MKTLAFWLKLIIFNPPRLMDARSQRIKPSLSLLLATGTFLERNSLAKRPSGVERGETVVLAG